MVTSHLSISMQNYAMTTALDGLSKNISYDDYLVLPFFFLAAAGYLCRGILWDRPDPYQYKWFERPQQGTRNEIPVHQRSRNIAEKLEGTNLDLVILWGSQSGTAEGFAQRIAKEFRQRFRLEALVADLSDYDPHTITLIPKSKIAIFVMSTYGEGDPSDNSSEFLNWLKSNSDTSLESLRYAAFGLGNSSYRFYNKVIDDVVAALGDLGAVSLLPVGKGNEATRTTEEDFMEWKNSLFPMLASELNLAEYEANYTARMKFVENGSFSSNRLHLGDPFLKRTPKKATAIASSIAAFPIKERRELTLKPSASRNCVHMELDLSAHPEIKYKTGDHIAVWPTNPNEEVVALLRILDLESRKDVPISVLPLDGETDKLKVPSPTTIQALFQHYLEICAPVPRETVLSLAQLAATEKVKSVLKALGKDKVAYATFLEHNHLTLARLLKYTLTIDTNASWTTLPLSFVVESLPPMAPRYYSISSSSITSPRRVSIMVAVKASPLLLNPEITIPGLASTYISSLQLIPKSDSPAQFPPHTTMPSLHAQIRQSTFRLPPSSTVPLIMVAAGTGIAPFRGFLQDRARFASTGRQIGPMILFFGCQCPEYDLYGDELVELMSGPLDGKLEIVTAFSRVGNERKYVQHRLQERGDEIGRLLLEEDASFYVCGAANMARAVEGVVRDSIKRVKGWKDSEVDVWRQERKRAKRWHEDVWG